MAHGGRREGAGRRRGALGKRTVERQQRTAEAIATEVSPTAIMYKNMMIWDRQADAADHALGEMTAEAIKGMEPEDAFNYLFDQAQRAVGFRKLAQEAACDLAPFREPRLSNITAEVKGTPRVGIITNIIYDPPNADRQS